MSISVPGSLRFIESVRRSSQRRSDTLSRLATGLRIRKAADDAAGKAIAETLRARIASTQAARYNINHALDTVQIAEEGIGRIIEALNRSRTLAVAAASETYDDESRAIMQDEVSDILDQIDEIAVNTVHTNEDIKLLAGGNIEIAFLIDTSASMNAEINALRAGITDFETALNLEKQTITNLIFTEDYGEAITAFGEKRKPQSKGR